MGGGVGGLKGTGWTINEQSGTVTFFIKQNGTSTATKRTFNIFVSGQRIIGSEEIQKILEVVRPIFNQLATRFNTLETQAPPNVTDQGQIKVVIDEKGSEISYPSLMTKLKTLETGAANETETEQKARLVQYQQLKALQMNTNDVFEATIKKPQEPNENTKRHHQKLNEYLKGFTADEVAYARHYIFHEASLQSLAPDSQIHHRTLISILNETENRDLKEALESYKGPPAEKGSLFRGFKAKKRRKEALGIVLDYLTTEINKNNRLIETENALAGKTYQTFTQGNINLQDYIAKEKRKSISLTNFSIGKPAHAWPSRVDKARARKRNNEIEKHVPNLGKVIQQTQNEQNEQQTNIPTFRSGKTDTLERLQELTLFSCLEQLKVSDPKGFHRNQEGKLEFEQLITSHLDSSRLKSVLTRTQGSGDDEARYLRELLAACDAWPSEGYTITVNLGGHDEDILLKKPRIANQIFGVTIQGVEKFGVSIDLGKETQDRLNFVSNGQLFQDYVRQGMADKKISADTLQDIKTAAEKLVPFLPTDLSYAVSELVDNEGMIDFSKVSLAKLLDDTELTTKSEYKAYQLAVAKFLDTQITTLADDAANVYRLLFKRDPPVDRGTIIDKSFSIVPKPEEELHVADMEIYRNLLCKSLNLSQSKQCQSGTDRTIISVALATAQTRFQAKYGFDFLPHKHMEEAEYRLAFKKFFREVIQEFGISMTAETKGYSGINWGGGVHGNPVAYKYLFNESDIRDAKLHKIPIADHPDVRDVTPADYRNKGKAQYKGTLRKKDEFYGGSKKDTAKEIKQKRNELFADTPRIRTTIEDVAKLLSIDTEKIGLTDLRITCDIAELKLNETPPSSTQTRFELLEAQLKEIKEDSSPLYYCLSMIRDEWIEKGKSDKARHIPKEMTAKLPPPEEATYNISQTNILSPQQRVEQHTILSLKSHRTPREEQELEELTRLMTESANRQLINELKSGTNKTLRRQLILDNTAIIKTDTLFKSISDDYKNGEAHVLKQFCIDWVKSNKTKTAFTQAQPYLQQILAADELVAAKQPNPAQQAAPSRGDKNFKTVMDALLENRFGSEAEYKKQVQAIGDDIGNEFIRQYFSLEEADLLPPSIPFQEVTAQMRAFIQQTITSTPTDKQARVMKFFINIAQHLQEKHLYAAVLPIYQAIQEFSNVNLDGEYPDLLKTMQNLYTHPYTQLLDEQQKLVDTNVLHIIPIEVLQAGIGELTKAGIGELTAQSRFSIMRNTECYDTTRASVITRQTDKYLASKPLVRLGFAVTTNFFEYMQLQTTKPAVADLQLEQDLDKVIENATQAKMIQEKNFPAALQLLKDVKKLFDASNMQRWVQYHQLQERYKVLDGTVDVKDKKTHALLQQAGQTLTELRNPSMQFTTLSTIGKTCKEAIFKKDSVTIQGQQPALTMGETSRKVVFEENSVIIQGQQPALIATVLGSELVQALYSELKNDTAINNSARLIRALVQDEAQFMRVLTALPGLGGVIRAFLNTYPDNNPEVYRCLALDPNETNIQVIAADFEKLRTAQDTILSTITDSQEKSTKTASFEQQNQEVREKLSRLIPIDPVYKAAKKEMNCLLPQIQKANTQSQKSQGRSALLAQKLLCELVTKYQKEEQKIAKFCGNDIQLEQQYMYPTKRDDIETLFTAIPTAHTETATAYTLFKDVLLLTQPLDFIRYHQCHALVTSLRERGDETDKPYLMKAQQILDQHLTAITLSTQSENLRGELNTKLPLRKGTDEEKATLHALVDPANWGALAHILRKDIAYSICKGDPVAKAEANCILEYLIGLQEYNEILAQESDLQQLICLFAEGDAQYTSAVRTMENLGGTLVTGNNLNGIHTLLGLLDTTKNQLSPVQQKVIQEHYNKTKTFLQGICVDILLNDRKFTQSVNELRNLVNKLTTINDPKELEDNIKSCETQFNELETKYHVNSIIERLEMKGVLQQLNHARERLSNPRLSADATQQKIKEFFALSQSDKKQDKDCAGLHYFNARQLEETLPQDKKASVANTQLPPELSNDKRAIRDKLITWLEENNTKAIARFIEDSESPRRLANILNHEIAQALYSPNPEQAIQRTGTILDYLGTMEKAYSKTLGAAEGLEAMIEAFVQKHTSVTPTFEEMHAQKELGMKSTDTNTTWQHLQKIKKAWEAGKRKLPTGDYKIKYLDTQKEKIEQGLLMKIETDISTSTQYKSCMQTISSLTLQIPKVADAELNDLLIKFQNQQQQWKEMLFNSKELMQRLPIDQEALTVFNQGIDRLKQSEPANRAQAAIRKEIDTRVQHLKTLSAVDLKELLISDAALTDTMRNWKELIPSTVREDLFDKCFWVFDNPYTMVQEISNMSNDELRKLHSSSHDIVNKLIDQLYRCFLEFSGTKSPGTTTLITDIIDILKSPNKLNALGVPVEKQTEIARQVQTFRTIREECGFRVENKPSEKLQQNQKKGIGELAYANARGLEKYEIFHAIHTPTVQEPLTQLSNAVKAFASAISGTIGESANQLKQIKLGEFSAEKEYVDTFINASNFDNSALPTILSTGAGKQVLDALVQASNAAVALNQQRALLKPEDPEYITLTAECEQVGALLNQFFSEAFVVKFTLILGATENPEQRRALRDFFDKAKKIFEESVGIK